MADGATGYYGTGHRKSATAKVWLFPGGTGSITVNGKSLPEYVCRRALEMIVAHGAAAERMGRDEVAETENAPRGIGDEIRLQGAGVQPDGRAERRSASGQPE